MDLKPGMLLGPLQDRDSDSRIGLGTGTWRQDRTRDRIGTRTCRDISGAGRDGASVGKSQSGRCWLGSWQGTMGSRVSPAWRGSLTLRGASLTLCGVSPTPGPAQASSLDEEEVYSMAATLKRISILFK